MSSATTPHTLTLDALAAGNSARVQSIDCADRELRNKLLAMGIVEGVSVKVTGHGPFGCPLSVSILGSRLALRKNEARAVRVNA